MAGTARQPLGYDRISLMPIRTDLDRRIWHIAWPAILSNLSVPLLGIVDTALLGHLESTRYLGAAAIGASILSFVYWGFGFIRMGTTGLVARAVGAGDRVRELTAILQSLVLAFLIAVAVLVTFPLWCDIGLGLMNPGPAMEPWSASYLGIRIYSAPAALVTYAVVGWFIGHQNTRWPMAIVVFTNLLNVGLDVLFIWGLDLRSDGAAMATLIAEYAGCLLALWALSRRLDLSGWHRARVHLLRMSAYGELLTSNRNLFVRTVCLLFTFAFFTAMSTRMGEDMLAANTIILQLVLLTAYGLDGFTFAVEGLAGTAAGASDMRQFRRVVRGGTRWSLLAAAGFSLVFLAADPLLFPMFTDHAQVLAILGEHVGWLIALPLVAVWCYLFDGVFIGASRAHQMMTSMLFSVFAVYLPCWYLTQPLGNHGLWLSFLLFNAARGITLYGYYRHLHRTGGWLD